MLHTFAFDAYAPAQLAFLSATDAVLIFLLSKPFFVIVALALVLTAHHRATGEPPD